MHVSEREGETEQLRDLTFNYNYAFGLSRIIAIFVLDYE